MSKRPDGLPEKRNEDRWASGHLEFKEASTPEEREEILSPEAKWEGEEKEIENPNSKLVATILAILLLIGIVAATIYFANLSKHSSEELVATSGSSPSEVPEIRVSQYFESTDFTEIEESGIRAVEGFMRAKSPEEAVKFIAGGNKRLPELVDYYSRPENQLPQGFKKIRKPIPNAVATIPYLMIWAQDEKGEEHGFVVTPGKDRMLIDWACSVEYGEMSKDEFFSLKPETPVRMRYYLEFDPLRNIGDNGRFFRLTNSGRTILFHALQGTDSEVVKYLQMLARAKIRQPTQVKMIWNDEHNCPEIVEIERIWMFDYEALKISDPEIVIDEESSEKKNSSEAPADQ